MGVKFPTSAWVRALGEALNASESYAKAARNWEGDFYFVVEAGGPIEADVHLYMDLWHGQCREAGGTAEVGPKNPVFVMRAPYATWKKVIQGELDPLKGLVARKLKLSGDMTKIMRAPQAAKELVDCCARIDTEFPE